MRGGNLGSICFFALLLLKQSKADSTEQTDLKLSVQDVSGDGLFPNLLHNSSYNGNNTEISLSDTQTVIETTLADILKASEVNKTESDNKYLGGRKSMSPWTGDNSGPSYNSRAMHPTEYFRPVDARAAENPCLHEGQFHFFWSTLSSECFVCVCSGSYESLSPVCAMCSACGQNSHPDQPIPRPTPVPDSTRLPPIYNPDNNEPSPLPPVEVSCDPLPTNIPFENPLNPCQTCVCRLLVTAYGVSDVQIACQENNQCVNQPDFSTPMPLPPIPPPQPLCDKFPKNVWFPHPNDACKSCRCTPRYNDLPDIKCIENPECQDMSTQHPYEPFPISTTQQIPWPPEPTTTMRPIPPGPLPGPPPHESCKPFPPQTPFQHPWDECQMCVCTEAKSFLKTEIEVNCYTKRECCIEYAPINPTGPPLPGPTFSPALIIAHLCEYKPKNMDFIHPEDPCRTCKCQVFGDFLAPTCKRLNIPACVGYLRPSPQQNIPITFMEPVCRTIRPNTPFVSGCNLCVCETVYKYVIAKCLPQPDCRPDYIHRNSDNVGGSAFSLASSQDAASSNNKAISSSSASASGPSELGIRQNQALTEALSYPGQNGNLPGQYHPIANRGLQKQKQNKNFESSREAVHQQNNKNRDGLQRLYSLGSNFTSGQAKGRNETVNLQQQGLPAVRSSSGVDGFSNTSPPSVRRQRGDKCKHEGDMFIEQCMKCHCLQDLDGSLYSLCYGEPCVRSKRKIF